MLAEQLHGLPPIVEVDDAHGLLHTVRRRDSCGSGVVIPILKHGF